MKISQNFDVVKLCLSLAAIMLFEFVKKCFHEKIKVYSYRVQQEWNLKLVSIFGSLVWKSVDFLKCFLKYSGGKKDRMKDAVLDVLLDALWEM